MNDILKGDIYWVDFGDGVGSEQAGERPAVIIQNNLGNLHSNTVQVAAITSKPKNCLPTNVIIYPTRENGLNCISTILMGQVRTVDKKRLINYIGRLNKKNIDRLNKAICVNFDVGYKKDMVDDISKFIENRNNIKLMSYQKQMIESYLICRNVYVGDRMGKSTILEGISEYFKCLDNDVDRNSAEIVFDTSILYRDIEEYKTREVGRI